MKTKEKIENFIKENNVCLFMKGTPENPVWFFNGGFEVY